MGMTAAQELDEIFRMTRCAMNAADDDDLLSELLDGFSRSVPNVLKMRAFWVKNRDRGYHGYANDRLDGSGAWRVLSSIDAFLKAQMSPEEFKKATTPPPPDPKATTILEEFDFGD